MPKWKKAIISRWYHSICLAFGTGPTGVGAVCPLDISGKNTAIIPIEKKQLFNCNAICLRFIVIFILYKMTEKKIEIPAIVLLI